MGDLSSVSDVYQYSGEDSGFTKSDDYSKEKEYTIIYSGMDEELTEKAAKTVLSYEKFGANDNKKAGELYRIFLNDCNTFTNAVFKEYKKLWKNSEKENHPGVFGFIELHKAWKKHLKEITKDKDKTIDLNNKQ